MNDAEKRELIDELRDAARCEDAHLSNADHEVVDMQLRAAAALEATLWKPIEDAPWKTQLLLPWPYWSALPCIGYKAANSWHSNVALSECHMGSKNGPTHYQEITKLEEQADEAA